MNDHRINECSGIGAGIHQADLTDHAVQHGFGLLLQLIGVDRESVDVAMKHQLPGVLAVLRIIEIAFHTHTAILAV